MPFPSDILARISATQVVAGFSVDRVEDAAPIAKALYEGGLDVIELTLRTPVAMDAIRAIAQEVPETLLGVGTILTPDQAKAAKAAGAHFGVSPGMNPAVITACMEEGLSFAPGIATPSDLEAAISLGCDFVKFFPAEAAGGIPYLKSMSTPYKHLGIQYFPLGGVNAANMVDYLTLPDVPAIGGSWVVTKDLVQSKDWAGITERAAEVRSTFLNLKS